MDSSGYGILRGNVAPECILVRFQAGRGVIFDGLENRLIKKLHQDEKKGVNNVYSNQFGISGSPESLATADKLHGSMLCVTSLGKCCNTCKIKGNLQNKIPPNVLQNRILFSLLSFIPVSLSSSFNPTHPDISPFLQIISKYTLLQTLPDLITILSCMSLLFLFPSSSLSHCLSPSSDYLLSLSLSLPRTLSGSQILKIEI